MSPDSLKWAVRQTVENPNRMNIVRNLTAAQNNERDQSDSGEKTDRATRRRARRSAGSPTQSTDAVSLCTAVSAAFHSVHPSFRPTV